MKRGTASRVFFGVDKINEDFGGLLLLSQVTLGKKSGMFDEHKGLCIVDNVLLGKGIARVISVIIRGTSPLSLPDAIADSLSYVKAFGGTGQNGTPTPTTPIDIVSNNGVLKYSANIANVNVQTILLGYYISAQGVVTADTNNWIYQDYIPVSPNTTYTLTMSSPVYYVSISEYSTASDSGFIIRKAGSTGTNTTLTITTSATTNFIRFGTNIDRTEVTLEEVLAINWQLNKGSSMPYTPYSPTGLYTDGTVETIGIRTRNLYDANSNKAFVEENTQYTISLIKAASRVNIAAYDTNDTLLGVVATWSSAQTGAQQTTFTTPENTKYIVCKTGLDLVSNVQIEQGSTATDYVPYYDGGTATTEMLLKVGDYQDVQSIIDGVVTRNVGVKVLDGTEAWATTLYPQTNAYRISWSGATRTLGAVKYGGNICTHFEDGGSASTGLPNKIFFANDLNINFPMTSDFDTRNKCVQWLADQYNAGTPVIVVYPLATPTTESVAGQTLQVTDGDNVLEITQASLTGLELEAEYQAAVSLTIQEVQDANLDPNVEVTIN